MSADEGRSPGRGGLFFDRDGTLIHDKGYLHDPSKVALLPGVRDALRALRKTHRLFLFTNQSGVGRGYYGMDAVLACNGRLEELLGGPGFFDGVCVAPEHPDDPPVYRKPCPRYILETIERFGLDPGACAMFGDRTSDLEAGVNAGIRSVLVVQDRVDEAAAAYAAREPLVETAASLADWAAAHCE